MKRNKMVLVAAVLSGSLLFSSCVGSFGLFNRLTTWNQSLGNKFVNELVFLAFNIVPVYGVAYLADALVINSIEFWSGSNPMANVGDVKKVKGENGNYMVKTLEIIDGKLTGRYLGDVVDGKRKAELLRLIAQVEKVDIAQTIAVGDGANDLPMLGIAGLGIAFHAKPKVVANAKQSINTIGLDGVLYFLGFKDSYLNM